LSIGKRGRVNGGKGLSVRRMDKGGQKREGLWVGKGEGLKVGKRRNGYG
jgi:hypothetical protein